LHARLPASELVLLPGVGHYVNLAAPEAFEAAVRRLLGSPL
jgi:pimeloyl-ACP methyl ester carboxylesterase